MSFVLLQSKAFAQNAAQTPPQSYAFDNNVSQGSLLVMGVQYAEIGGDNRIVSMGGNSNAYTEIGLQRDTGNSQIAELWYSENANSGATSVQINPLHTGTNEWAAVTVLIAEFSGVLTSGSLRTSDTTKAFASSSTTPDANTSNNITPTVGDLVISLMQDTQGNAPTLTAGTGFSAGPVTSGLAGKTGAMCMEYKTASSSSSMNATFTSNTSGNNYTVQIAAFIPVPAVTATIAWIGAAG